jgi:hypothetical protein
VIQLQHHIREIAEAATHGETDHRRLEVAEVSIAVREPVARESHAGIAEVTARAEELRIGIPQREVVPLGVGAIPCEGRVSLRPHLAHLPLTEQVLIAQARDDAAELHVRLQARPQHPFGSDRVRFMDVDDDDDGATLGALFEPNAYRLEVPQR